MAVSESEMKVVLKGTTVLGEKIRAASALHQVGQQRAQFKSRVCLKRDPVGWSKPGELQHPLPHARTNKV